MESRDTTVQVKVRIKNLNILTNLKMLIVMNA